MARFPTVTPRERSLYPRRAMLPGAAALGPAAGRALAPANVGGRQLAVPSWIQVSTLPGAAVAEIRVMGQKIFKNFGAVDLTRVMVRTSLMESKASLDNLARHVVQNSMVVDEMSVIVPTPDGDVECAVKLLRSSSSNDSFVFVEDKYGRYIYQFQSMPQLTFRAPQDRLAGGGPLSFPRPK